MAPGSKYSSSLYMNPKASLDLINPDTTNSAPTNTRDTQVNPSNAFNISSTVVYTETPSELKINANRA